MKLFPLLDPAGSDTEVQFNDGNLFGADSSFTFNDATKIVDMDGLTITGTTAIGLDMSGGTFATAVQKWPAGTIQTTGTTIFRPLADSTTAYQWQDQDDGLPLLNIDSTNENVIVSTSFTVKNASAEIIIHADDNEFYVTELVATEIVAGNPIGLLLVLTYPATP